MGLPLVALQLDFLDPALLPLLLIVAGIGLSLAEALAPGAHFVVLGVALLAAGLVGLLLGPLAGPIVLALLVFLFGALALYGYREFDIYGGKGTGQTSDSDSLKGKTGRVTERVTPTDGEIKLDSGGFNPYYAARSLHGEIPEGTEVMVVDPGGGNVVTVESLDLVTEDEIDRELRRGREARGEERQREEETERA
ncbi:Membrane protein implicated in regulation of membrane protease activity [Halogranum rubrum]|uniref:Membrane protein implicated in regulation of membrane protease activity n=1 Tax=Halogranum rubrum TaxID=553466 RepID=A0A1I4E6H4_9EURY|nr:NfeD family protein [Halogranum rubrum]SFL01414.1 Membrane protein implicated in regulation of membrane protease activity [Halogranum rubrum]